MQTYHIHINGIVQGVGFRPMVYLMACQMKLKGTVHNSADGVHIYVNASKPEAELFLQNILLAAPTKAKIISSSLLPAPPNTFPDFSILTEKENTTEKRTLLPPDIALCKDCRGELHNEMDHRYRYPFITCTQCGPRYSIIKQLPYEREFTAMAPFSTCGYCSAEYKDVTDRRFFSQTNSCPACGIELQIWESPSTSLSNNTENVLLYITNFLLHGKIIAVKGLGGYLLMCSADDPEVIQALRTRKKRPSKPFAVIYPNIETVRTNFELSTKEQALLESAEAPIVLLQPRQLALNNLSVPDIAPGLQRLGIMIPYNPLLELITTDYGMPLIATSANISGSPIFYKDDDALTYLFDKADFVVTYNRDIIVPQDDSVVQVSRKTGLTILLRRSRGYAPSFLDYRPENNRCVLSTGAFLKSSFTLSVNGNIFVSQFLGSGESYESQQMYKDTLQHWLQLYQVIPAVILADKHPDYFSHQYAVELAATLNSEIKFIQHHEAHFAAVLAENNLLKNREPVMGVIWDGTGLGDDGNIWGGEFFRYTHGEILRCYHFDYFPAIAGEKLALEPRIAALCLASDVWPPPDSLKDKFSETEWNNYQALLNNTRLYSSSVGRIFDSIASLLNICDRQTYEGEAAMYLQALAQEYVNINGFVMDESYFKEGSHYYRVPTASLIQGIALDVKKGKAIAYIAAKFHYSLVCLVGIIAQYIQVEHICFSGGVFQNMLLVDWIHHAYNNKYQLYFHNNLSPNDENISFGQYVYYENNLKSVFSNEVDSSQDESISQHS